MNTKKTLKVLKTIGEGDESLYVYYFPSSKKGSEWPCKIGYAKEDVVKRVCQQQASMFEEPVIALVIKSGSGITMESLVHCRLKLKRLPAFGNEWFMTSPEEVEEIYEKLLKNPELLSIGEKIKMMRIKKGLTQEKLSRISGVSQVSVSFIERGSNVSMTTVEMLAHALGKRVEFVDIENKP